MERFTMGEVVTLLEAAGIRVTPRQVDHAVRSHRIPVVDIDGAGNRQFKMAHVAALIAHFQDPPKRGRPPRSARAPLHLLRPTVPMA